MINTPNVVHRPRVWLFPLPYVTEISSINSRFSPCFDIDRSICGYLKVHFQCDMKVSSAVISLHCLPYSVQRSETATFYARQLRKSTLESDVLYMYYQLLMLVTRSTDVISVTGVILTPKNLGDTLGVTLGI